MKRRDLLAGSRIPLQPLNSLVLISLFPIGPSTLHPHSAFPPRPIPHFVGSFNLPAVAGRLQTAAAVAQEGSISISVPPRPPRPALASQLFVNLEHPPNRLLQPPATAASPSVESSMSSLRLSPQPWLARHESTLRSTSCSAVHHHQDRAGQSQHAHIRPRTPSWIHSCGRCRFRAADAARFKQSIPRRPRRLASRGISWHSAGRSSGRPPGPQTGLAKLAKHNKQHSSGPLLVPPLPPPQPTAACPSVSAVANLLGSRRSFSSHPWLRCERNCCCLFWRWPYPALLPAPSSATIFPCRSPERTIDANPLQVMLLFSPFA